MSEGLLGELGYFPVSIAKSRGWGRKSNLSKAKGKACEEMEAGR